ncbi:MAG: nucleotidyl transferase AbiEii/AbiGii toxin family protein [Melioribacteraceae bacterium]|nr:nucleotidyl transferase AbiEii/AbiGii toxin family protein [Melioribacteraceae bacterium]
MQNLIKSECFTAKWIKTKKDETSGNSVLIEKTIHAFALLGYLVQLEPNFIFKGGTSLLLHLPKIKRLSIDIDIMFGGDIKEFITKLSQIPENVPFTRFEEDVRGNRGLPNRKHFKFFYTSSETNNENSVLLDVVLEETSFIKSIEDKAIVSDIFETDNQLSVKIPSIEGLLGDKLTAFAPHTIGVPFVTNSGKNMSMQVAKQLFDIGELFDVATDFEKASTAFKATFEKENSYHSNKFSETEVLEDTIDICHSLCSIRLRGFQESDDTNNIQDGIRRLSSHLLNEDFRTDSDAKITAAKVFYIANSIKANREVKLNEIKYSPNKIAEITDVTLPAPYNNLNRLKPILPEAFYYIWMGIKD